MKKPFKLYWVETPSAEENCFVAARSERAAARYEEDGTGFDRGDCEASLIRLLDSAWVETYYKDEETSHDDVDAFYIQPEDVHQLGVQWRVIEGDDVFEYEGHEYLKQGDLNYIASIGDNSETVVIRSVEDLLAVTKRDTPGDWIFRGHSSWRWKLQASVHRIYKVTDGDLEFILALERKLLNEFKRRARIHLQSRPSSDWEWMILAQHFGLPTRILDWTENPLVALYFSVCDEAELSHDGMLFSYHHGSEEIDIESTGDPFSIKQIELVRPPHLDQRVIAQQSVFTAEPPLLSKGGRDKSNLRYWYISVHHKKEIRRDLKKLSITENSLFPGLESLATEIKNELVLRIPQAKLP
jgi:hypothetical protein